MKTEAQTINFIIEMKIGNQSAAGISKTLEENGYTNMRGQQFSIHQVNSLLHSANQLKRKAEKKHLERCGIDREANPCGDASDY